ncbi:hypothetical protein SGPA1_20947 [Streptomyces misionensis JCM 4497]
MGQGRLRVSVLPRLGGARAPLRRLRRRGAQRVPGLDPDRVVRRHHLPCRRARAAGGRTGPAHRREGARPHRRRPRTAAAPGGPGGRLRRRPDRLLRGDVPAPGHRAPGGPAAPLADGPGPGVRADRRPGPHQPAAPVRRRGPRPEHAAGRHGRGQRRTGRHGHQRRPDPRGPPRFPARAAAPGPGPLSTRPPHPRQGAPSR